MSLFLLPFVSLAVASGQADATPKSLATVLSRADAIVSYAIADHQVSFTIEEDGETVAVHATTRDDGHGARHRGHGLWAARPVRRRHSAGCRASSTASRSRRSR